MDGWGYVFLAYGIIWSVILLYVYSLKRSYRRAEARLEGFQSDAQE